MTRSLVLCPSLLGSDLTKTKKQPAPCRRQPSNRMYAAFSFYTGPPPEVLFTLDNIVKIFSYLSARDLCSCALVCKSWNEAVNSNLLWRHLYWQRFVYAPRRPLAPGGWRRLFFERSQSVGVVLRTEYFVAVEQLGLSPFARGPIRLNIVGDRHCGKTAFINTMAYGEWSKNNKYTRYNNRIPVTYTLRDHKISFFTMDSTDEVHMYLRTHTEPDVNIVCFSIAHPTSVASVIEWVDALHAEAPHTPFMLVALQVDNKDIYKEFNYTMESSPRIHTVDHGILLAKRIGAAGYYEVSARETRGLVQLLEAMYVCAWNSRQHQQRGYSILSD